MGTEFPDIFLINQDTHLEGTHNNRVWPHLCLSIYAIYDIAVPSWNLCQGILSFPRDFVFQGWRNINVNLGRGKMKKIPKQEYTAEFLSRAEEFAYPLREIW